MSARSRIATVYLLGFGIDLANMFMLNAAYPAVQRELRASVAQLAWIGNAYVLGLTVVIPLGAWLARRYGERRTLVGSLALFGLASAGVGSAKAIDAVLAWRLMQGLGGGLLIPVGQAMAYRAYPPEARAGLTSVVMMVALLIPALSPALGGLMADRLSWRTMFLGMLPLGLACACLALAWLPQDETSGQPAPLDLRGLVLSTVALVALLLGLTWASEADVRRMAILALGVALAAVIAYAVHARRSHAPVIDLRLLAKPLLRVGVLVYLCVPGVFTGVNLVASLYLQDRFGLSAAHVGTLMLPWALASFVAIATMRARLPRWGARPLFAWGIAIDALGIALLATPLAGLELGRTAAFAAMGFGASLCTSTAQSVAFLELSAGRMGEASALWNINRQLSFCLGVAVLGSALQCLLSAGVTDASLAYRQCFGLAALLTLLPLVAVARLPARSAATVAPSD